VKNFYAKDLKEVYEDLGTSDSGLSVFDANEKAKIYGPNELPAAKQATYLTIFISQFKSPLIYILMLSGVVVLYMKEYLDAGVIGFVLFFNALIGTIQEGRAQNTLLAIQKFSNLL
jgi:magnesium-transporting ATPase (P-type)